MLRYSLDPAETDVLLPTNARFKVNGIFNAGSGLIQIQLEELPCLEDILDFNAPDVSVDAPSPLLVPLPLPDPSPHPALADHDFQEQVGDAQKKVLNNDDYNDDNNDEP